MFGRKRRFVSAVGKESVVNATSAVAKFEFEAFNWFLLAITRAAEIGIGCISTADNFDSLASLFFLQKHL